MAEVLDAVAGVLRRDRGAGQQVAGVMSAAADTGADVASTAVEVSADVASGAVDASTQIAAAAVDMAGTAAEALATVATDAVLNMLPGGSAETAGTDDGRRGGGRKRQ
jgi:hypothetical protein